ncbi:MAG: class I SAM-dependent methyltransferase, partial [Deltaproteobacteria bacterium]|nr:class I SAM-dependent methyltransferase [Deltaproteobacteria bacterium]
RSRARIRHAGARDRLRHRAVTARLLDRGALVTAVDQNPAMLEQARSRLSGIGTDRLVLLERTASEIDALSEADFDAVVASLSLSEMSPQERAFVLRESLKRLRQGGVLAIADEVVPRGRWRRVLFSILRGPQAALAWLFVGATSHAIRELGAEMSAAGAELLDERRWQGGMLALIVARKR